MPRYCFFFCVQNIVNKAFLILISTFTLLGEQKEKSNNKTSRCFSVEFLAILLNRVK